MKYEFRVNEPVRIGPDSYAAATDGEDVAVPEGTVGVVKKIDRTDDDLPYLVAFPDASYVECWFTESDLRKVNEASIPDVELLSHEDVLVELVPTHSANGTGWSLRLFADGREVLVAPHGDFGRVLNGALHELGVQTR